MKMFPLFVFPLSFLALVTSSLPAQSEVSSLPTESFVLSKQLGTPRNNFTGFSGMRLTVGSNALTVTHLGRIFLTGNSQTHLLKIVRASDKTDVPNGSVTVAMAGGTSGQFKYGPLAAPVVLSARTTYYLVSEETNGGDRWCNLNDTSVTTRPVAGVNGGVFIGEEWPWTEGGGTNRMYGPLDFMYQSASLAPTIAITNPPPGAPFLEPANITIVANASSGVTNVSFYQGATKLGDDSTAPFALAWTNVPGGTYSVSARARANNGLEATSAVVMVIVQTNTPGVERAFVVSRTLGRVRNDFTGFVGMRIKVGPTPISVTALGRIFVGGNRRVHQLKIVQGADQTDAPGGIVSIEMTNGASGQFKYAALAAPVVLPANTTNYIVSSEIDGGDTWYDINTTVTTDAAARVESGIYQPQGDPWSVIDSLNHTYGPLDFKFLPGAVVTTTVNLANPPGGATFALPTNILLEAAVSGGSVTNVEFFANSTRLGEDRTSPYTFSWTNPPPGSATLSARASTAGGSVITSAIVNIVVVAPLPPSIAITNPPPNTEFTVPASISLAAVAGSGVTNVLFLANGLPIGEDDSSPFALLWNTPLLGTNRITAVARAGNGLSATSSVVNVIVSMPMLPSVVLDQPNPGATFVLPAIVALRASASGGIAFVEFFAGSTKVGESSSAPYAYDWVNPPAGPHILTAKATAPNGLSSRSSAVTISVQTNSVPPGSAIPFVVNFDSQAPRNDFSGFLGMVFQVGSNSITVTALGRAVLPGNSGAHVLKLIRASSGEEVAGGQTIVSAAGVPPNGFQYNSLPAPVVLEPFGMFYLVSSEVAGGDEWYDVDRTSVITSPAASVLGGVYGQPGEPWVVGGAAGHTYIPVDFKFSPEDGLPPVTVVITSPVDSSNVRVPTNILLEASTSLGVTNVSFYSEGLKLGQDTSSPFASTWTNPPLGEYVLRAIATARNGLQATSGPVHLGVTPNVSGVETNFVWQKEPRILRNDYTGFLGVVFAVGSNSVTVTRLGRYYIEGNTQIHRVKIVHASTGADVSGSEVSVDVKTGVVGDVTFTRLPAPVVLHPQTMYYLVSEETLGGDLWYDSDRTKIKTTAVGASLAGVYGPGDGTWVTGGLPGHSYGPVDFKYLINVGAPAVTAAIESPTAGAVFAQPTNLHIAATASSGVTNVEFFADGLLLGRDVEPPFSFDWTQPPLGAHHLRVRAVGSNGLSADSLIVPISITTNLAGIEEHLIVSKDPQRLRNDYTGFLGMAFTVGSNSITVTRLGRIYVPGNTGRHQLKIVDASTGLDVPGGVTSLQLAPGAADEFQYAFLPHPIVLLPNRAYYLLSEEALGGDEWYDLERTTLASSSVVTLTSGVYGSGSEPWINGGLPGHGYIPLDLKYLAGAGLPPVMAAITEPVSGSLLRSPTTLVIHAVTSPGVTNVAFFSGGILLGSDIVAPFSWTWLNPPVGNHTLTAKGIASNGLVAESLPINISVVTNSVSGVERHFLLSTEPQLPRNDFTGFLGMQLRVGASPITVTRLGRMYLAGNSNIHLVKFVRAVDGTDVPGGAVALSLAGGGSPGEFIYQFLPQPVVLEANAQYYLVSAESLGGDSWFDLERTTVTGSGVAEVEAGVYAGTNGAWVLGGLPGHSYVPVDFKYLLPEASTDARLSVSFVAPGGVTLRLRGVSGATYTVEESPDLVQWTKRVDISLTGPEVIVFEQGSVLPGVRFFRARRSD